MKFKVIAKPRFLAKFKQLILNHPGDKIQPFPGKSKVRWAIGRRSEHNKLVCIYEGKASIQAIECTCNCHNEPLYLLEFDRAGIFFIQTVKRGFCNPYNYVAINSIYQQYHKNISPEEYLKSFHRSVRKEKLQSNIWMKSVASIS